ncbi:SigE family RNA polymerase sigma factor [Nocardioidaceae bacterium SCSIO 66511]|nr:SigE family RNA polymerase sigma factor [Nocardioidaceae bacterium SCSIO 66511]
MSDRYDGFREFFAARRSDLSRTAFFLTGDDNAAEDLLQEAMVKTAAKWHRIHPNGNPDAYVRQVMLNLVRSRWRRRQKITEYATDEVPEVHSAHDIESAVVAKSVLGRALQTLTARQRATLYFRYYEDLSEAETARLLGCSTGTVKSQSHAALAKLRETAPHLLTAESVEVAE